MFRYDVFRALNPTQDYPSTLFNLCIKGVPYDLPLPPEVCDAIFDCNYASKYERIDHLCSPNGIAMLRDDPGQIDHPDNLPAFAGCEVREDITGSDYVTGYTLHLLAFNEAVIKKLFVKPVERDSVADKASHWISEHIDHFAYCGGFEVARFLSYSTPQERAEVEEFVSRVAYGGEPDDLLERNARKLRFRDMVNAKHQKF